jgi:cytochrome c oxidase subunit III
MVLAASAASAAGAGPLRAGMKPTTIVGDVSGLPAHAIGHRTLLWWGVLGFIVIESVAFLLAGGSYFFLMNQTTPWPPGHPPPALLFGALFTAVMVISELPNFLTERAAHAHHAAQARAGLVAMSLFGVLLIGLRLVEFQYLNVHWDQDAYGSIVWALMFIHATHLVTDVVETIVLTVFTFTNDVTPERFADIADGGMYWHFVTLAWLPVYALIYWVPRWQA